MDYQAILKTFKPGHSFFAGIDSDGCVFDSMEVKQKEFFIPAAIRYFDLFRVSKQVRETWEFVNLYSVYRGGNRFVSLVKVFELLASRDDIRQSGIILPDLKELKSWISNETKLGNATLREYCKENNDKFLNLVLKWSEHVNKEIGGWLHDIPPFRHAVRSMKKLSGVADIMVVSQTPLDALEREWFENDLKKFVSVIAGQEHGTKTEHIALAAKDKYSGNKILMIGDAFGDLNAAKSNGILFFPINPGNEDLSWELFLKEGLKKFMDNTYAGSYEEMLISEFKKSLPVTPPWK